MKMKVFGWLIVGCLLYVCPSAMGQTVFSSDIIGSNVTDPPQGGILATPQAPWTVTSASVSIQANGKWKSVIKGLVVPTIGTAAVTQIAEALVCGGTIVASTPSVALDTSGNAKIKATVTGVPSRCVAPTVFVFVTEFMGLPFGLTSNPQTQYIAVSGFSTAAAAESHNPLDDMGKK